MHTTKEVERILRHELDNWLRWGKKRDWMPASFGSVLGRLYVSRYPIDSENRILTPKVDENSAAQLEGFVVSLPDRQRMAFVAHHLGTCVVNGWVVKIKNREEAAKCIGVQKSRYGEIVNLAHLSVWGKYESLNICTVRK